MVCTTNPLAEEGVIGKFCTKCSVRLPFSAFHRSKNMKDGHYAWCKECRKPYCQEQYEKHIDKIKIYNKNNPADKSAAKIRHDRWVKENPERDKQLKQKAYLLNRERDKDKRAAYGYKYSRENKEKVNESTQRRRARKKENDVY